MRIGNFILTVVATIMAGTPALAWEYQGHEMVGAIADRLLNANAKQQVRHYLGFSLQEAAPWPDCVRSVVHTDDGKFHYLPPPFNPEYRIPCKPFEADDERTKKKEEVARMEDYAQRNWVNCAYNLKIAGQCHAAFHFADVSIKKDKYDRSYVGTSDHDIVSAINAAIAVLQDRPAPPPFSIKDKKEALFMLAHFVGDLHQPLHVGAVYLDLNGKIVNPDDTGLDASTETQGGNLIKEGPHNFHSEWDAIPETWGVTPGAAMLAEARGIPATQGAIKDWAGNWASDTVKVAQTAFNGLTFFGAPPDGWTVEFADRQKYEMDAEQIKFTQLAKGGARLAQLLNSIWP
jgi:S1/P1 Nuclease